MSHEITKATNEYSRRYRDRYHHHQEFSDSPATPRYTTTMLGAMSVPDHELVESSHGGYNGPISSGGAGHSVARNGAYSKEGVEYDALKRNQDADRDDVMRRNQATHFMPGDRRDKSVNEFHTGAGFNNDSGGYRALSCESVLDAQDHYHDSSRHGRLNSDETPLYRNGGAKYSDETRVESDRLGALRTLSSDTLNNTNFQGSSGLTDVFKVGRTDSRHRIKMSKPTNQAHEDDFAASARYGRRWNKPTGTSANPTGLNKAASRGEKEDASYVASSSGHTPKLAQVFDFDDKLNERTLIEERNVDARVYTKLDTSVLHSRAANTLDGRSGEYRSRYQKYHNDQPTADSSFGYVPTTYRRPNGNNVAQSGAVSSIGTYSSGTKSPPTTGTSSPYYLNRSRDPSMPGSSRSVSRDSDLAERSANERTTVRPRYPPNTARSRCSSRTLSDDDGPFHVAFGTISPPTSPSLLPRRTKRRISGNSSQDSLGGTAPGTRPLGATGAMKVSPTAEHSTLRQEGTYRGDGNGIEETGNNEMSPHNDIAETAIFRRASNLAMRRAPQGISGEKQTSSVVPKTTNFVDDAKTKVSATSSSVFSNSKPLMSKATYSSTTKTTAINDEIEQRYIGHRTDSKRDNVAGRSSKPPPPMVLKPKLSNKTLPSSVAEKNRPTEHTKPPSETSSTSSSVSKVTRPPPVNPRKPRYRIDPTAAQHPDVVAEQRPTKVIHGESSSGTGSTTGTLTRNVASLVGLKDHHSASWTLDPNTLSPTDTTSSNSGIRTMRKRVSQFFGSSLEYEDNVYAEDSFIPDPSTFQEAEVLQYFEKILEDMGLKEDKKAPLRMLDLEKKRQFIKQNFRVKMQQDTRKGEQPDYFFERLTITDSTTSTTRNQLKTLLADLRVLLRTKPLSWHQDFGSIGLSKLLMLLNSLSDTICHSTGDCTQEKLIQTECMKCIVEFANNNIGIKQFFENGDSFRSIVESLNVANPSAMLEALTFLATFTLINEGPLQGTRRVLDALTVCGDQRQQDRFLPVVLALYADDNIPLQKGGLMVINGLINNQEELDRRFSLRNQFMRAGMIDVVEGLKNVPELTIQMEVFEDQKMQDFEDHFGRVESLSTDLR